MQNLRFNEINRLETTIDTVLGVMLCAWLAAFMAILYVDKQPPNLLPLLFVVVVAGVARYFGTFAGVLGCVIAALIFALFVYEPFGSIAIAEHTARANLLWMILLGLILTRLFPARTPERKSREEPPHAK
jgi:K+-sensing histidine kinase KdpD